MVATVEVRSRLPTWAEEELPVLALADARVHLDRGAGGGERPRLQEGSAHGLALEPRLALHLGPYLLLWRAFLPEAARALPLSILSAPKGSQRRSTPAATEPPVCWLPVAAVQIRFSACGASCARASICA